MDRRNIYIGVGAVIVLASWPTRSDGLAAVRLNPSRPFQLLRLQQRCQHQLLLRPQLPLQPPLPRQRPRSSQSLAQPEGGAGSLAGVVCRHESDEFQQSLAVPRVRDSSEVAGQLGASSGPAIGSRQVSLRRLEKVSNFHVKRLGELIEPASRDAVHPGLVLLRLLAGDADQFGHLLLSNPQDLPALADASTDRTIHFFR